MSETLRVENDDDLNNFFIGVEIPVEDIAGRYRVPGWQCRLCGWTIGARGYPPAHNCPEDGLMMRVKRLEYQIEQLMQAGQEPQP